MSPEMLKMWVSIAGIGFMFLAIFLIYLSRFKLKSALKFITAFIAYVLLIFSAILIFIILFA